MASAWIMRRPGTSARTPASDGSKPSTSKPGRASDSLGATQSNRESGEEQRRLGTSSPQYNPIGQGSVWAAAVKLPACKKFGRVNLIVSSCYVDPGGPSSASPSGTEPGNPPAPTRAKGRRKARARTTTPVRTRRPDSWRKAILMCSPGHSERGGARCKLRSAYPCTG